MKNKNLILVLMLICGIGVLLVIFNSRRLPPGLKQASEQGEPIAGPEHSTLPAKSSEVVVPTVKQPNEDSTKLAGTKLLSDALVKMLTPSAATASDWSHATVTNNSVDGGKIPYWTLIKMRPILEADTNTTSFHTQASNKRGSVGGIVTTIWSDKIRNTLEVKWANGSVAKARSNPTSGINFSENHGEQNEIVQRNVSFTTLRPDWVRPAISISVRGNDYKWTGAVIPFDHTPYNRLVAFVPTSYPIAAMPEWAKVIGHPSYILLVDTDNIKIVGEIPLPADLSGRPTFVLDKENDVLLVTQFDLSWLIAIDLRPYMKMIQKE